MSEGDLEPLNNISLIIRQNKPLVPRLDPLHFGSTASICQRGHGDARAAERLAVGGGRPVQTTDVKWRSEGSVQEARWPLAR